MRLLRVYRALAVAELQAAAQYRIQASLWLLLSVIRPVVFLSAWVAIAQSQGGSVGGLTVADFAAYYVALALVLQLTQAWNAYDFDLEVRQGTLSSKLLRPLHPLHYSAVENAVYKVFPLIVLMPVLGVVAWRLDAHLRLDPLHISLFLCSVTVAALLRFMFGWMVACLAFWTTRTQSLLSLVDRATFLFGGQVAPLALMPGPLQAIGLALPFGFMFGVPSQILSADQPTSETLALLGGQCAWLAGCTVVFLIGWRAGTRQYSAVGA